MGGNYISFNNMVPTFVITIILGIALFSFSLVFRYYEDYRRASPNSVDYKHAFVFFVRFLVIGTLFLGLFLGLIIANMIL
jgi:hypothetical protein